MDNLLKDFSLVGLVSLAVMTVVCSALFRRVIELAIPSLVKVERKTANGKVTTYKSELSRWYNEFVLYMIPYVCAALFAISKTQFLFGEINTYVGRMFLAVMVATFSAMVYKAVKKAIPGMFGVQVDSNDDVLSPPAKD
jgi:hypothetical protein